MRSMSKMNRIPRNQCPVCNDKFCENKKSKGKKAAFAVGIALSAASVIALFAKGVRKG